MAIQIKRKSKDNALNQDSEPNKSETAQSLENFERELRAKYFDLITKKSIHYSISALHNEMNSFEPHVFDFGFDKVRLQKLQKMRNLARDLYNYELEQASKQYKQN